MDITELARIHHAYETIDGGGDTFQRRARILQSIWRVQQEYEPGTHRDRLLGSRLPMPWAKETLSNYLTDTIKDVVRDEVLNPAKSRGKLYGKPKIFDNLLSSQPLCFNLFGELQRNLPLATMVFRDVTQKRVAEVTAIDFEHSPGRGDPRYLNDGTAFDVYVEFIPPAGGRGFIGIEVKYHETLKGQASTQKDRYDEVADEMGCFGPECRNALRAMPLQQIWRDHLLMGATKHTDGYDDGFFVFLYPKDNDLCASAITQYRTCLSNENTFSEWLLEDVVTALRRHTKAEWVELFHARYLAFDKVDTELAAPSRQG